MLHNQAKIEYKLYESKDEGRAYKIVLEVSLEKFLKDDSYKCNIYNRIFDFLEDLRDKHTPDNMDAIVKFQEED